MNKTIRKSILTIIIILLTLCSFNTTSFAATYNLTTICNWITSGNFIDNPDIKLGQTVNTIDDNGYPYNRVGVYCIENTNASNWRQEQNAKIRNIIDLKDGKVIVRGYEGTKAFQREYTSSEAVTLMKRMAYHAKRAVDNRETVVYENDIISNTSDKYKIEILFQANKDYMVKSLGLDANVGSSGNQANLDKVVKKDDVKNKNYRARFVFLDMAGDQDQIIFSAQEETKKYGDIEIKKVDEDGKKQENVEFYVTDSSGKYVSADLKNGVYTVKENKGYVKSPKSATKFKTDANGKITIKQLLIGNYIVKEVKNPNYGYADNKGKTIKALVKENTKLSYEFKNTSYTGNLKVIKVDKDNNKVKLSNVEFYIKKKGGKYVTATKSGNTYKNPQYVSLADAKKKEPFKTDENGEINIQDLLKGTYIAYEVKNPNHGYEIIKEGREKTVEIDKTAELKIENEKVLGNLKVIKVDKKDHQRYLDNVEFTIKNKATGKYVNATKDGNKYVTKNYVGEANATKFKTDKNGEILIEDLHKGTYIAYEQSNPHYGYEIVKNGQEMQVIVDKTQELMIENTHITGNLKVIKIDKDNKVKTLPNVEFDIKNKATGKYVVPKLVKAGEYNVDSDADYVNTVPKDNHFKTDANGQFTIKNLLKGDYIAIEVKNPDEYYGFNNKDDVATVEIDKTEELKIENEQIYVDISGIVWLDKQDAKLSRRNDLYNTAWHPELGNEYQDGKDEALNGIKVQLVNTKTGEIKDYTTKTIDGQEGKYIFKKVLKSELKNCYIKFEYDGLLYTNVDGKAISNYWSREGSSKAGEEDRDGFNKQFTAVEGGKRTASPDPKTYGIAKGESGNKDLVYDRNYDTHITTLSKDENYFPIYATTKAANYKLEDCKVDGNEIKNINLGIREREQPNISIDKDITQVKVAINNKEYIYNYNRRSNPTEATKDLYYENGDTDSFNVGVKFGSKYRDAVYSRAIYKEDYQFTLDNGDPEDRELKVYVTYKTRIRNTSASDLAVKVNSLVEYYDSRYMFVEAGTGLEEGKVSGDKFTLENIISGEKYTYGTLNLGKSMELKKDETKDVYTQYQLNRNHVQTILDDNGGNNGNNLFKAYTEIASYTTYKDGAIYAGIDKNSNPANLGIKDGIMDDATIEDDTDMAPGFKLEVTEGREITGNVFEDISELKDNIRQGDGIFDANKEKGVSGVKVTYTEISGSGKTYTPTAEKTGDDGKFTIKGFIPGDYVLTYEWGDENHKVTEYKGTVYNDKGRQNNEYWYKDIEPRYSDAMDNFETRKDIDSKLSTVKYNISKVLEDMKNTKMLSTTPQMNIGVEYETNISEYVDKFVYSIKNVDFGIVERPKQEIALDKEVETFKVTLANGEVVADARRNENGEFVGNTQHMQVTPQSENNIPKNGQVMLTLDSGLLQGAVVEVGYAIKATNNSEIDYVDENFYKYGEIPSTNENIVKLAPADVIDYLDKDWTFDSSKNPDWKEISVNELNGIVHEDIYNTEDAKQNLDGVRILHTTVLKDKALKPGDTEKAMLNVSKVLAITDDTELNNEAEVIEVTKNGGSKLTTTPGNYIPGTGKTQADDDTAENVVITPNFGENQEYVLPIVIITTALVVLGAGALFIKKKIIRK